MSCAVYGCNNYIRKTKGSKIVYHRFPKDQNQIKRWILACCRKDKINIKNARICSEHFDQEAYKRDFSKEEYASFDKEKSRNLKENAIPTKKLPTSKAGNLETADTRTERMIKRARKKLVTEILKEQDAISVIESESTTSFNVVNEVCDSNLNNTHQDNTICKLNETVDILTKERNDLLSKIEIMNADMIKLKTENIRLKYDKIENFETKVTNLLSSIFTPGQIKCLFSSNCKKRINWSSEDITAAISLRRVSPKAYRYLRDKLKYPLPGISTLRRWAPNLN